MAYENYTIRQYMNAMWKGDRSVMNDDELRLVNSEYIDTAQLYETEEFERVMYIHFINSRITTIKTSIKLQKMFIEQFDICYTPGLEMFVKFGHHLKWTDKQKFLKGLDLIEKKERMYISVIENKSKELIDLRSKKINKEQPVKVERGSFIRTIAILNKEGYRIEYDTTRMEELAHTILLQKEKSK